MHVCNISQSLTFSWYSYWHALMEKMYLFKNRCLFHRCEINLDLCGNNPCQNGGACVDSGNGVRYTCICQPGYTGDNCETDISECCSLLLLMCPVAAFIKRFKLPPFKDFITAESEREAGRQAVKRTDRDRERNQTSQTLFLNASWHASFLSTDP